jgi:hypothetical protein
MIRRRRPRYAVLIVAIGCVILALSCGLGALAVRQGAIPPPNLNLQLGGVRVVGITSRFPDCTQLIALGCLRQNQAPTARIYTLWLFMQSEPNSWNRPQVTQLLAIRVGR